MHAPHRPFASSSLPALRLLVGFVLAAEEAAPGRALLLGHAGASGDRPCRALAIVLCALRRRPAVRGVLDGVLAAALGRDAESYAHLSPAGLARCWQEGRDALAGRELAALLWQVARRGEGALRRIEDDIARTCPPSRLLSPQQRALDLLRAPAGVG